MTLAKIGTQTINLALVVRYQDVPGPEGRIELVLLTGAAIALEGREADAIRRFIAANAVDLLASDPDDGPGQFAAARGPLRAQADRAEQGG